MAGKYNVLIAIKNVS